jgi:WD40 repeat protein
MGNANVRFQRPIVLSGPQAAVYALSAWKDGFLSGDGDGKLVYWQPGLSSDGQVIASIPDRIFSIQVIAGQRIVVGTLSGDMFWLDLSKPAELPRRWRFHEDGLFGLSLHGNAVFAIGGKGRLSRWSVETGEMEVSRQLDSVRLRSIAWLQAANCLVVGTANGDLLFVEPSELRLIDKLEQAHELTIFSIVDGGERFTTTGRDGAIRTWSAVSPWRQLHHVAAHATTINALSLRQNSSQETQLLASASRDREIRLWRWERDGSEEAWVLAKALTASRDGGHAASVNCCMWLGDMLITGGDDRTIRCWPLLQQNADV